MNGNSCVLDTSVIIHSFRKKNDVAGKLNSLTDIFVPVIVVGELYFGAYKSDDVARHMSIVQSFLQKCKILQVDSLTADVFGAIKAALIKKGKPIPENDIWIGAIALQHNLPLFTADAHFKEISGLVVL